jgi:hypothetical protein
MAMSKLLAVFIAAGVLVGFTSEGRAAEQAIPAKIFLVKDPPAGPQARMILWRAKDQNLDGDLSLVGDPTAGGAKLRVRLQPSTHCSVPPCVDGGGDQCFDLPASGWSAIGSRGFKYADPTSANGAVKVVSIKQTASGTFLVKAVAHGAGIDIFLEDETGFYGINLALGGGDEYQSSSGGALPKPNDGKTFRVRNEDGTASFPGCSPSGAFVD